MTPPMAQIPAMVLAVWCDIVLSLRCVMDFNNFFPIPFAAATWLQSRDREVLGNGHGHPTTTKIETNATCCLANEQRLLIPFDFGVLLLSLALAYRQTLVVQQLNNNLPSWPDSVEIWSTGFSNRHMNAR
jgi:hypothetical protein